jgi:hypothetical protein
MERKNNNKPDSIMTTDLLKMGGEFIPESQVYQMYLKQ